MVREDTQLSFDDYFWQGVDVEGKTVLDAGTGFGLTTVDIAERMSDSRRKGKIISVDIDSEAFERAQQRLRASELQDSVSFVEADLSNMPQVPDSSVDVIMSTRTLCAVNAYPCRVVKAMSEFHRVLAQGGQIVVSDECPLPKPKATDERVGVMRWQLVKALSDLLGERHWNEVEPDDLEFVAKTVGFKDCRWATFKGEEIPDYRIHHFVMSANSMIAKLDDSDLAKAFTERIETIKKTFKEEGGVFAPVYILHASK